MAMAAGTDIAATTIGLTRENPRVEARQSNNMTWRFSPPNSALYRINCYIIGRTFARRNRTHSTPGLAIAPASVGNKHPSGVWR